MRRRHMLALLTAAGLVASGGLAYAGADPHVEKPPRRATTEIPNHHPATVTLVTGDKVVVNDDGPVRLLAGL